MSNFNDFFSGAGVGGQVLMYRIVKQTTLWQSPYTGTLDVQLIGGHGGGSVARGTGNGATGAGAGENAVRFSIPVTAGDSYMINIGSGGASVNRTTNGFTAGIDGGATTFVGPNANITANGGKGGGASASRPLNGGAGGSGGTGGDLHMPGGRGGNLGASAPQNLVTGSGAVNLFSTTQTVTRGGDVIAALNFITGGGGTGGRGGDVVTGTINNTGGGGYGGDALDIASTVDNAEAGPNALGVRAVSVTVAPSSPAPISAALAQFGLDVFGGGSPGRNTTPVVNAAQGGGTGGQSNNAALTAPIPGLFGGPGGLKVTGAAVTAANGVNGPGGSVYGDTGTVTSGAGDTGVAILIVRRG